MSAVNYNIDQHNFFNRFYVSFITAIGFIYKFLQKFHIKHLKTGIVSNLFCRLAEIHLKSEGLVSITKDCSQQTAAKKHGQILEILQFYVRFHSRLSKINFFNNTQLEALSEGILDNFYTSEASLRNIAFQNKPQDPKDKELLEFASHKSIATT